MVVVLSLALAMFAQDLPSQAPLPAVAALLHDVERNQDSAENHKRDYTYHLFKQTQDLDKNGNVKKTVTEEDESFRIDGILVNRAVTRNGKALTPDETKKENERIDKEVAKEKEKREKLKNEGKVADANGNQELSVSRILELGEFSNERRVALNGRPTIVVDYAGDPKAKTKNQFETVVRDLVGTVWIDEADRTIVQLQGHFLNDFKVAGGLLADIQKNSNFSASFVKINDEAWLPSEFDGEGRIRILLFGGFNGKMKTVASDYRKYRAKATIVQIGADAPPDASPGTNTDSR